MNLTWRVLDAGSKGSEAYEDHFQIVRRLVEDKRCSDFKFKPIQAISVLKLQDIKCNRSTMVNHSGDKQIKIFAQKCA